MKVRLILKGYIQNPNMDYDEVYKTVLVDVSEDKCDFSLFNTIVGGEIVKERKERKDGSYKDNPK